MITRPWPLASLLLGALVASACSDETAAPSLDATAADATADATTDATTDATVATDATVEPDATTDAVADASADVDATTETDVSDAGSTIAWAPCASRPDFECGTLEVPLSWKTPGRGTLEVAVTRRPALSKSQREGALLFLAGGPGQSGIDFAQGSASGMNPSQGELLRRFDLVGMDVRGTGRTGPIVECVDDAKAAELQALAAAETDDEALDAALDEAIAGCLESTSADVLGRLDSASVARDIDRFREALGDETISLLGGSYGTWVAAVYASRFPTRVRAAVLASSLNGSSDAFERVRSTTHGIELALGGFFAWCDAEVTCALRPATGTTEDAFVALLDDLATTPLTDSVAGRARTLDASAFGTAVLAQLYDPQPADLAATLAAARDGSPTLLLDVADGYVGEGSDWGESPLIITTLDTRLPAGATVASWADFYATTIVPESPIWSRFTGRGDLGVRVALAYPYAPDDPVTSLAATDAPPFLIVSGDLDPVTPREGARTMATALGNGSVILETAHLGHFAYQDPCVVGHGLAYLLDLTLPTDGTRCSWPPPTTPPDETVVATATAAFVRNREALRIGEDPLGDLVADAMLAAAAPLGAKLALMNSGGIQNGLPSDYQPTTSGLRRPPGEAPFDLLVQDTRRVLRFGNRLAVTDVTGAELRAFLERSLAGWTADGTDAAGGVFVQIAGLHLTFDGDAAPGSRVVALKLADGAIIDDATLYRIAVPDYVLYGGTFSSALAERTPTIGAPLDEVLADYLRDQGTVTPTTDGRITRVTH